jgi:hypothetical protein
MRHLVPTSWDGHQALLAAALLKDALDAVWAVHGEAMAERIADVPRHRWSEFMADENNEEDDIPF